jgi:uncharacterized protein
MKIMKNLLKTALAVILSTCWSFTFGQNNPVIYNANDIIQQGIVLYENGKYDSAINKFRIINIGDSAYFRAQYELSLAYLAKEDYSKVVALSQNAIEQGSSEPLQYNTWGTALDNMGKPDEAIKVYNQGIEKFKYNTNLHFNKAIVYEGMGDNKTAFETYQHILSFSPYHASTHLRIARLNKADGWLTQAIMAYTVFLIIEPSSNRSLNILLELNSLCDGSLENIGSAKEKFFEQEFEDIDVLISNQVALNSKFVTPSEYTFPVIRQIYLLINQFKELKEDSNSFFGQYYVPFFKKLNDLKPDNNFSLIILASSDNKTVAGQLEKDLQDVIKIRQQCLQYWRETHLSIEVLLNSKIQNLDKWFDSDLKIQAFGKENKDGKNIGEWMFIGGNGNVSKTGQYNINGEQTGQWNYFSNEGDTSAVKSFEDGKLNGNYRYLDGGILYEQGNYKDGLLHGSVSGVYPDQSIKSRLIFVDDKRNGIANFFSQTGLLKTQEEYENGDLQGIYKTYHPNGVLSDSGFYQSKKLNGNYKQYFMDGNLMYDIKYKNGIIEGDYKTYYRNGNVKSEGLVVNGSAAGKWKYYFSNGSLSKINEYDEQGKYIENSENYDYLGKLITKYDYNKGKLKEIQAFDSYGKIQFRYRSSENDTIVINYDINRNKISEGIFKDDNKVGEWKNYYNSGQVSSTQFYKENNLEGNCISFYTDGSIYEKRFYVNDKLNGPFTRFYDNGALQTEGNFKDDEKWGNWFEYYNDGTLKTITYFIKNSKVGFEFEYGVSGNLYGKEKYNQDGIIIAKYLFDFNNVVIDSLLFKTGSSVFNFKDRAGNTIMKGTYKNGLLHGNFQSYYSNSQLRMEGEFFAGLNHGEWIYYHPNGKIKSKGSYFHGEKTGLWESFDIFGNKFITYNYQFDLENGLKYWYYNNGNIESEINNYEDNRHGKSVYYAKTGEIREVRYYLHGYYVGYSYLNAENQLVDTIFLENGNGSVKAFYPNGNVSTEYTFLNGDYHGSYKIYYPGGSLQETRNYNYGNQIDSVCMYYSDGKLFQVINYCSGDRCGERKEYNPDESLRCIENYRNGVLHGLCEYYDCTGKLINAYEFNNGEIFKLIR